MGSCHLPRCDESQCIYISITVRVSTSNLYLKLISPLPPTPTPVKTSLTMSLFTSQTPSHPLRSLIILFAAWKTLLLTIALGAASSPAYDTSTNLLFSRLSSSNSNSTSTPLLAKQLTRWDALYFIHASHDAGKIYEQEYAFSTSLSSLLNRLSNLFSGDTSNTALFGILVAHLTHLISVLALYRLTYLIFSGNKNFAYVSSALHIVSPAGLFLSSPYAESPFSCLTFTGSYVFALSYATPCRIRRSLLIISAGGVFGLATWFRSNGLASGLLFAVALLQSLQSLVQAPKPSVLLEVLGSIVGGSLVAAGSVVPQYHAWQRFCLTASPRPWCEKLIPSIYTFVQEHYW